MMPAWRLCLLALLAMLAFAANSLLCRAALAGNAIDAASFTAIRLIAGALTLLLLITLRQPKPLAVSDKVANAKGNWGSALALFVYASAFSFAYTGLNTATGALLLFASVQVTMIGLGLFNGERLTPWQWLGFAVALSGLLVLLFPGIAAPAPVPAALMICSGIAWGYYSIRGRKATDATAVTAGNFCRTVPLAFLLLLLIPQLQLSISGVMLALASGALASGLGYALWYSILPAFSATVAASLQLSVPVLAAILGAIVLAEPISLRVGLASVIILSGIAIVILCKTRPR